MCGKGKGEAVACCVVDAECVQLGVTCDACMTCDTHMSRDTWLQRGASVACAGRERQRLTSTVTFASCLPHLHHLSHLAATTAAIVTSPLPSHTFHRTHFSHICLSSLTLQSPFLHLGHPSHIGVDLLILISFPMERAAHHVHARALQPHFVRAPPQTQEKRREKRGKSGASLYI